MEKHTPKIKFDKYVEVLLEGQKCKTCNKIMLPKLNRGVFPNWLENNQNAQMLRAGLVYKSTIEVDDEYICIDCEKAGKADFSCALCEERRPSDQVLESFGDPAEHLCTVCYETKSAKVFEEKRAYLYDKHQYDFD